jgi:ABC-type antimicrobial peptide transport system permease subunit
VALAHASPALSPGAAFSLGMPNQLILTFWARSQRTRDLLHEPMILSIHDRIRQPHGEQLSDRGQQRSDALAENLLHTVLLTFFAATALSLACIGLYGTLSYNVNLRQREVGLRLALGALRGQIVKRFLWQGLSVCLAGCLAGFVLAVASTRLLAGLLYGVSPTDFPTLVAVILLVLIVAAAASLLPSLRASRLEPMQVLREE